MSGELWNTVFSHPQNHPHPFHDVHLQMIVKQPGSGIGNAKTDNGVAADRNDDDVTHGRVNKFQGQFTTSAPSWFRAESVGAADVFVWAGVTSGGAVELWVARGQHGEVVAVHVDWVMLQVVRVDGVVVGEHHLDGFVVR